MCYEWPMARGLENLAPTRSRPRGRCSRYRPYWAQRFGMAPFLPTTRAEMDELGWD